MSRFSDGVCRKAFARMRLPIVGPQFLPDLAWTNIHDDRSLNRCELLPVTGLDHTLADINKPAIGGLWTSPIDEVGGQIVGTPWTRYGAKYFKDELPPIWRIHPDPATRVLVIDSREHLGAAIARWPENVEDLGEWRTQYRRLISSSSGGVLAARSSTPSPIRFDFAALACDIDVIYLTARGQSQTANGREPNLWGWDMPTGFWLNPTFTAQGPIPVPTIAQHRALVDEQTRRCRAELLRRFTAKGAYTEEEAMRFIDIFLPEPV